MIFKRVPSCASCKNLSHAPYVCYITNPGVRKPQQREFQGWQLKERGIQPKVNGSDQYVVVVDNQPQEPSFQPSLIEGKNSEPSL